MTTLDQLLIFNQPELSESNSVGLTERQKSALKKLESALIEVKKSGILLIGLSPNLYYATNEIIELMDKSKDQPYPEVDNNKKEFIPTNRHGLVNTHGSFTDLDRF